MTPKHPPTNACKSQQSDGFMIHNAEKEKKDAIFLNLMTRSVLQHANPKKNIDRSGT